MDLTRIGVVGCGTMGHGIAQVSAQSGFDVVVRELSEEKLAGGLARIDKALERLVSRGKLESTEATAARERIRGTTEYGDLADCELVIEAVFEDLEAKRGVWRALDAVLGPHAVCATNTSSLSVVDQATVTGRANRFVGLHFFNPPQVMALLEAIRAVTTGDEAYEVALEYGRRLGKDVVEAPDRAGFIVNRLLLPYTMDAVRAFESGYGLIADIDTAMRGGAGYPMGPFTLLDFVGLDIALAITEVMFHEYREPRFAAPPTIRKLVAAGFVGRKSGRGFYDYSSEPPVALDGSR